MVMEPLQVNKNSRSDSPVGDHFERASRTLDSAEEKGVKLLPSKAAEREEEQSVDQSPDNLK